MWSLLTGGPREGPLRTMGSLVRVQLSPPARTEYFLLLTAADLIFPGLGDNGVSSETPGFLITHPT